MNLSSKVILIFFIPMIGLAKDSLRVTINTPFNTPAEEIYISGNFPQCHWRLDCYQLQKIGPNTFETTIDDLPKNRHLEYKIHRGRWETQAANSRGRQYNNSTFSLENRHNHIIQNVLNWKDLGALKLTGQLNKIEDFYSPRLNNSRDIHIWLPHSYTKSSDNYPVIYFHDGQNGFDPNQAAFGVDWAIDDQLSNKNIDAIVVGIFSKDRGREFNHYDQGKEYSDFIVHTLKPYIDNNYRTLKNRENTFLMGSSWGAVISVTTILSYPEVFSKASALSLPAFTFDRMLFDFLKNEVSTKTSIELFFDHGTVGGDKKYKAPAEEFYQKIQQKLPHSQIKYQVYPYASHTEADWARRLTDHLEFLF